MTIPETVRQEGNPMKYDLVLTGGEVLDPSAGYSGIMDIGINHGVTADT